ncbi:ABC transporter substrate-binding protein [Streptomyces nodosus]|uniref:Extracellular solute-binding protein n=1 Tax=Streptomyces nodosus TaxID=40318 RepID=A0A0B5DSC7_9ACTN|nr:ABC transporter substrate-binding protein [Streptomyces nodosus]AJE43501.1 spermidine/putrescine ABC transporter substrate-binding protein [Streptomyces nodosus]MBB4794971.1 putative spermidine/putrescine transport system substrate-binding protein [Streptomyces nodosus]QEV43556.1 extracellular solute-binding protein [Streptomyces nodosus]
MRLTRTLQSAAAVAALLAISACGSSDSGGSSASPGGNGFNPPDLKAQTELGKTEGQVNLVNWAGYVEDGSNDPKVDWVSDFQKQTGCKVNSKVAASSDEMVKLMKTGEYDAVSASGDASLRLIASGDAAPVNTDLVPNYKNVFDDLKLQPWNSIKGTAYGIPHGRGANLLMYNTKKVKPAPTSWSAVFDDAASYKGHVTAYDSPIYIADAALYLKNTKPELKITDPYALDQKQFDAAVDLLKKQNVNVGEYWSDYLKEISAFKSGDSVVGTTWQVIANIAESEGAKIKAFLPDEGATGWSDTWMLSAKAKHPNCAYKWMDWIISPKANAQVAEYFGEAPANSEACAETSEKGFCDTYHAGEAEYWKKVAFWRTPIEQCLDGRTDVKCVPYTKWVQAWTEIKG